MALKGNWVDLLIIIFLFFYALGELERGFFWSLAELLSFVGSLAAAFKFYPLAAGFFTDNFSFSSVWAKAVGFLATALLAEAILGFFVGLIYRRLPKKLISSSFSRALGVIPGFLNGLVLVAFVLTVAQALPLPGIWKKDIGGARIGGYLLGQTVGWERQLNEIFGGAVNETLTFLTVNPKSREKVDLGYKIEKPTLRVDEELERIMLGLINDERAKRGIRPLVVDSAITAVARAHAKDMFVRGYFSHINPDGKDPFQRMREGGVSFTVAGENLALAPDVYLAHQGLMNSEGHRRNILDPDFARLGLGVIDGGVYGKMITQDFGD